MAPQSTSSAAPCGLELSSRILARLKRWMPKKANATIVTLHRPTFQGAGAIRLDSPSSAEAVAHPSSQVKALNSSHVTAPLKTAAETPKPAAKIASHVRSNAIMFPEKQQAGSPTSRHSSCLEAAVFDR